MKKKQRKKENKNILVLKGTNDEEKATDRKEEIARALNEVQIADSRFTNNGNIVMNFENESTMNEAAAKLQYVANMSTRSVKKLRPKVMICNVHGEENEGEIIQTLINRNEYLKEIEGIESKIDMIFKKTAAGGTSHYILRYDPLVRELFHKHNDRVKLQWGVYALRDRYHALACYFCQRHGHTDARCEERINKGEPHCFKCAGNHKSKECNGGENKCINCVRRNKSDVNHRATDTCCPILESEICRIRDLTDHGF